MYIPLQDSKVYVEELSPWTGLVLKTINQSETNTVLNLP